jgi:hypothetical protein
VTDTTLPAPLVPAEVDLNGFGFMPMLHHRVMQSTLFAKSTGDEFKAAFALWCASWSEKPAGSLPDDEEMLEFLSRCKTWKKVRARAMHGWIRCSDGRLYHPIIAPLAIDAWERREEFLEVKENRETRQERWRRRVKELSEQLRGLGVTPPRNASLSALETLLEQAQARRHASTQASTSASTSETRRDIAEMSQRDDAEMALTGTETGTETKEKNTPPLRGSPKEAKKPKSSRKCPPGFVVTDAHRTWAQKHTPGLDLEAEASAMRDHTFGTAREDWDGTFRNWLRRAAKDAPKRTGTTNGAQSFRERDTSAAAARVAEATGGLAVARTGRTRPQPETIDMEGPDASDPRFIED